MNKTMKRLLPAAGILVLLLLAGLLLKRGGEMPGTPTLAIVSPQRLSLSDAEVLSLDVTISGLGAADYPAASMSISFDPSRLEFLGIGEGNVFVRGSSPAVPKNLPTWSCNPEQCNRTGKINVMYLDMTGGKYAFSAELLDAKENVLLRLCFRLRGSVRGGDVCDLIFEDAVFAASSEAESLAMTRDTLRVQNGQIVVAEREIRPDGAWQTQPATQAGMQPSPGEDKEGEDRREDYRPDEYLSAVTKPDDSVYSDTGQTPGGQTPVGQTDKDAPAGERACVFSIECATILNNLDLLNPDKRELIPSDGVILPPTRVVFREGESVFDVLQRVCRENKIHLESSWTPLYNSAYIEGIHNLYEFDCGQLSGWNYRVNGLYPSYGCSGYVLADGDRVEWRYTCDLGRDIGCDWTGQ